MRVLIVEDETAAVDNLEYLLRKVDRAIEIAAVTESVEQTQQWLMQNHADLIFMDIHLSDGSAFSLFDKIEVSTPIIFTTAYDQYALDAFKVNSIDYLLKPLKQSDLERALEKFRRLTASDISISRFPSMMLAYLQDRGIHPDLISACIQNGTLYESHRYQNCVFVGKDTKGKARFACLRGTRDNFKVDVEGSDKRYNFALTTADPKCPRLAVAESPIVALSLATLVKLTGGEWRDSHYLSLGGTAPRAMLQFLHDHPHVTQVSLCLDNDKAGMEGMGRLEHTIREDPNLSQRVKLIYHNPPPAEHGKDYNEFLCVQIGVTKFNQRTRNRER